MSSPRRTAAAAVITVVGAAAVVAGAAWIALPLGLIFAGVLAILAGLFLVDIGPRRP